jgi:hypothetical protein
MSYGEDPFGTDSTGLIDVELQLTIGDARDDS